MKKPDALDRHMQDFYTSTVPTNDNDISLAQICEKVEAFFRLPRMVGNIGGVAVWIDPALPDGQFELRGAGQVIRCDIDHPYIQGTKLEKCLREQTVSKN